MIIGSFDDEPKKKSHFYEKVRKANLLAVPVDRLGAFSLDVVISYSFSGLLASPFQKQFAEAQVIGSMGELVIYASMIFATHLLTFFFYQSLSMSFFKQSIGQRLFKVRVVSLFDGKTLDFTKSAKRTLFLMIEIPFLIPFAGIFNDPFRRILHEKMSDSITLTDSDRYTLPPSPQEKSFIKGLLLPAYLWMFAVAISLMSTGAQMLLEEDGWLSELNSSIPHCEQVLNAMKTWPDADNSMENKRLMVALSLYSSKQIDKECLLSEADAAFLSKKDLEYAYLAKAFALEGVVELSDEYLEKVCEEDHQEEACLFTKLVNYWADSDWEHANKIVDGLIPGGSSFIRNYAIEHYMGRKSYDKAYSLIEMQSDNPHLRNFLSKYRSRALWNLGREGMAETSFLATKTALKPSLANKEQAWLCWKGLKQSCDNSSRGVCNEFSSLATFGQESVSDEELLAGINHFECSNKTSVSDLKYLERGASPAGKLFLRAYVAGDRNFFYDILQSSYSNQLSSELHYEIIDRLAKSAKSIRELDQLKKRILISNPFSSDWENSVVSLQNAYYKLNAVAKAEDLAEKAYQMFDEKTEFKQKLMIHAYNKSDRSWLKKLSRGFKSDRLPASDEDDFQRKSSFWKYDDIMKELKK